MKSNEKHKNVKNGAAITCSCLDKWNYVYDKSCYCRAAEETSVDALSTVRTEKVVETSHLAGNISNDKERDNLYSMDADGNVLESIVTEQLANTGKNDTHRRLLDLLRISRIPCSHESFRRMYNIVAEC